MVPGVVTVTAAYRMANNGAVDAAGDKLTDNAAMLGLTYALAMNMSASLAYTAQSGTAWDAANYAGVEPAGKTTTTLAMMV